MQPKATRPKPVYLWTTSDVQKWFRRHCSDFYTVYSDLMIQVNCVFINLLQQQMILTLYVAARYMWESIVKNEWHFSWEAWHPQCRSQRRNLASNYKTSTEGRHFRNERYGEAFWSQQLNIKSHWTTINQKMCSTLLFNRTLLFSQSFVLNDIDNWSGPYVFFSQLMVYIYSLFAINVSFFNCFLIF